MKQLENFTLNERHFRDIVESSLDMIFRLNEPGDFIYLNHATSQITGYSNEELAGTNFYQLIRTDKRNQTLKFYTTQIHEKNNTSYLELPLVKKDGTLVWIGLNMILEEVEPGVHQMSGIARDITEKINADKQKENWISRLLVLIENLQEGVLMEDENRKILIVNRAFCDLFSVRLIPEDLIGKSYVNAHNHIRRLFEDPALFAKQEEDVIKNRHIVIGQALNLTNNRVYERDFIPIYIETGYCGNLWKYRDSTEKVRIRKELITSRKKYQSVIETMRLGLMEVDSNDNIITANDAFCEMLGYKSVQDLVGKPSLETLLDKDQQILMQQQMANRSKNESNTYEIKAKRADGGHAWLLISGTSLLVSNDNIIGSMGIHLDITYQKRITIELEEKKALQRLMEWQEKSMHELEAKVQERTSEIVQQKEIIENKNKQITRSIDYALLIQQSLLPKRADFDRVFEENFIIYKPKDVVSGDFYFFKEGEDDTCYLSAVDSTGHGVPGGFMSMLGMEKLSLAVSKGGSPGQILSSMNASIKSTIRSSGDEIGLLDGYDMALCKIDLKNLVMDFSGAMRPIWIIKNNSNEILEIKGTRRSIGGRTRDMDVFDSHRIKLSKGDSFYIFTDGYTDQFNDTGSKITSSKFKQYLLSIQNKSMAEQGKLLDGFIESWKGDAKQTDDLLVIGVKM